MVTNGPASRTATPVTVVDTTVLLREAMSRSPSVQSTAATLDQARSQLKASKST